jgi:acetyl-CoA acetyltransferase
MTRRGSGAPAAIAGIGATEFSKDSGRSELRLAVEATTTALADAGIAPEEVDGLVTLTMDNDRGAAVARAMGMRRVTFFTEVPYGGGGACGAVAQASAAIQAGLANVVVCYRAMNERSQQRYGQIARAVPPPRLADSTLIDRSWHAPFGLAAPAAMIGMTARRYMHEYGATSADFGRVAVVSRAYAATNPAAYFFGKPITLDDHQNSRIVADPLHLLDCCQESDGGVALVIVSEERAQSLDRAVTISAAAQGMGPDTLHMSDFYRDDAAGTRETQIVGEQLWTQSGLSPADASLAIVYDHFSPAVLMQLEALGFCGRGEAPAFVEAGETTIDGSLPVNTNGGQLGEAYIHGFNGIAEAVRQVRGHAANQVANVQHAVVTSGSHVPTSGLVLSRR